MNTFMEKVLFLFVIFPVGVQGKDVTGAALNWTEAHSKCHRENKCLTSNPPGHHHPRTFWGSTVILKSSFLSYKGCFRKERFKARPNAVTLASPGLAMCETACMHQAKAVCKPTLWIGMQGNSCFCWCNVEPNVDSITFPENPHMCNISCGSRSWLFSGKCGGSDCISLYKRGVFNVTIPKESNREMLNCVTVSPNDVTFLLESCLSSKVTLCSFVRNGSRTFLHLKGTWYTVLRICIYGFSGYLVEDTDRQYSIYHEPRSAAYWTNVHSYTQILTDCYWQYPIVPNKCEVLSRHNGHRPMYTSRFEKCDSHLHYICMTKNSNGLLPKYYMNYTTVKITNTRATNKGRHQLTVSRSGSIKLPTSVWPAISKQSTSGVSMPVYQESMMTRIQTVSSEYYVTQTVLVQKENTTQRTDDNLTERLSTPDILNSSLFSNTQGKQTRVTTPKVMIIAVASSLISVISLAALTTVICLCKMRIRKKLSHQEQTTEGNEMKSLNCRLSNPYVNGLSRYSTVDDASNSTLQENMHRKDETENYYVSNTEETYDKLHGGRRRLQDDYASDIYSHANDPRVGDTEYSCATHNVDFVNERDSYGHYGYTGE